MNDAHISVLCQDDKLAAELEACLDKVDLGVDFVSPGWDAFCAHLERLRADNTDVLAFMSLAQLCEGGLDGLMEADAFFQARDHIHVVLLVEPWVSAERGSVELMTRFKVMLDVHLLDEQLGPLLGELSSALKWPGESFSADSPMKALFEDGDSSAGREVSSSDEAMISGIYGFSPKARVEHARLPDEAPAVKLTLPDEQSGDLSEVWLSRLLYSLYVRGFTGSLSLYHKRQEQRYSLQNGVIEDLSRESRQRLLSAFAWTAGRFEVTPGQVQGSSFTDDTLVLIYDGISGFVSLNRAAERLQGADIKYLVQTHFCVERADTLRELLMLQRFCTYCTGARNWSQLIALTWDDIRQVLKMACYALDTDLVMFRDEPTLRPQAVKYTNEVASRVSQDESSPMLLQHVEFDEIGGVGDENVLASRLQERLERFGMLDAYTIFGLYPTCGPVAVRERYYRLVKSYHPDVIGGNVSPRVKALAELTFIHIKDAYVELLELEDEGLGEEFVMTPSARHRSSVRRDVPSSAERYQTFIADKLDEALVDIDVQDSEVESPGAGHAPDSTHEADKPEAASSSRSKTSDAASPAVKGDNSSSSAPSSRSVKIRPARKRNTRAAKQSGTGSTRRVRLGSGAPAVPMTPVVKAPSTPLPTESPASRPESESAAVGVASSPSPPSAEAPRPTKAASGPSQPEPAAKGDEKVVSDSSGPALNSERRRALTARLPPQQHFKNGERLLRAGQYAKAREAFKHASKLRPEDPMYRAHYAWAKYMHDPHEEDSAIALLKECLAVKKGRLVEANLFLARIYKRHNNTKEALKYFGAASKLDKNCTEALRELRLHKMRQDKTPESEAPLEGEESSSQDATSKMKSFFGQLFSRRKS